MERTIYSFVIRHAPRETLYAVLLTLASMPLYYLSLEIPKTIMNQAILGRGITYPTQILGVPLDRIAHLFFLCALFFFFFFANGALKQYINSVKGRLGERLLRRLRFELVGRILRFPPQQFRKVSSGEMIPMITAEVESLGGFMGDAFVQPLVQGGTLLTIVIFLMMQNWIIGVAAMIMFPIQLVIIPRLQRRIRALGKERIKAMRKVSDRIGETVANVQDTHVHGTTAWERADYSERLGQVFRIRFEIYQRKAFQKFLNNFLNQVTPLLFYAFGGYLVITGDLTAGALTAALVAHKDMTAPFKELLDYYQQAQDAEQKYDQVTEQFRPAGMHDTALHAPIDARPEKFSGPIELAGVGYAEDEDTRLLESVTLSIAPGEKVAVIGPAGGGKEALAMVLGRALTPTTGHYTIGGRELAKLPLAATGARIGYAGPNAGFATGTLRDALIYGLRQRPIAAATRDEATERLIKRWQAESLRAGNLALDTGADWVDWQAIGLTGLQDFEPRAAEVLGAVDLGDDVYQFGLRGTIDPKKRADIADAALKARMALRERLADPELAKLVEPFDPARYNNNATLAENLLFGTPTDPEFETDRLPGNPIVRGVLDRAGLTDDLVRMGREVASTMVELFADLPPGNELFEQYSFVTADELPELQALLTRTGGEGGQVTDADRARLMTLPFKLIEARHRLGLLTEERKQRVLQARAALREALAGASPKAVAPFDPDSYNAAATLQDNILFGKVAYGVPRAAARVGKLLTDVLDALDLRPAVMAVGLDYSIGVAGARLSPAQRQKIAIARNLLKRPDLLVMNDPAAALDAAAQAKIVDGVLAEAADSTLVWVLQNTALAKRFDRVLVLSDRRLAEDGPPTDLDRPGTQFAALAAQ